jgi:AraC-like DNA-binding protein
MANWTASNILPHDEAGTRLPSPLYAEVTAYVESQGGGQGLFHTPVSGVNIIRSFQQVMPVRRVYQPSLCIVIQGAKEILYGEDRLVYGAMECLVVSIELPACGRVIEASPDAPFLGVVIDFDVAMLREVLEQVDTLPVSESDPAPCVFVAQVDAPLAECVLRLVRMTQTPKAIQILYPSIMREICYWLLSSERGGELRKLALPETQMQRIAKAIHFLRANFTRTLRVEQLADAAWMSPSSFHQHFKKLTSMTPLQYQKQLRLLEARRLLVTGAATVAEAAYQVGYESASQFSREYSRMFGVSPKRSVMNLKAAAA